MALSLAAVGRRFAAAAASPVSGGAGGFFHCVGGVLRWITPGASGKLSAEQRLSAQVIELQAQLAQQQGLERKYDELRRAAGLRPATGWRAIVAEAVSRDPNYWQERIVLNRGWEDGVATGALALNANGAVLGRILQFDRHSAVLATVLSPDCRFGVKLEGDVPGGAGVLRGIGEAQAARAGYGALADYLSADLEVAPGSRIVTSGLGGWLPENLLVGMVASDAGDDANALHVEESLRGQLHCVPAASLGVFRFAVILVPDTQH